MTLQIKFDFDKAMVHPVGYGYDQRPDIPLVGICVHSTEGARGSAFVSECAYLRDSPAVSAHYLISRLGVVQRLLDPGPWRAWHAGVSAWQGRAACNDYMVGIELHHTAGTGPYPAPQWAALTALVRQLMFDHPTISKAGIVCHRWIALPAGRKADPTDITDPQFAAWVAGL